MDCRIRWRAAPAWIVTVALTVLLSCGGCRKSRDGAVSVIGSTSVQPFAEMLAQEFNAKQSEVRVEVQGGGSTVGLRAIAEGIADVGMSSRDLKANEKFNKIVIARDGIAVVVHASNPVRNLSRADLRAIFSGQKTNWNQVADGDDRPIRLITREEGSGTREAFSGMVMAPVDPKTGHKGEPLRISERALTQESNGAVRELLRGDRCAIGYMSLGLVGLELKKVDVDGVTPTHEATENGTYALSRPFLFVFQGEPSVRAMKFVDFMLSDHAQDILQKAGLIRAPRQPLPTSGPASAPATKPAPGPNASAGGTWTPLAAGIVAVLTLAACVLVFRQLTPVYKERAIGSMLMLAALSAISGLALITVFIFREGLPLMARVGVWDFITSASWYPSEGKFGIAPMIVGSIAVTGGAIFMGIIFGLGSAVLLTQFCPPRLIGVIKPCIELLAAIPSVVYGFIGVIILVPFIRNYLGGPGVSVLASSIVLGIMVLPTVTSISIDALQAVPRAYREGSIALGATGWQTTHMVMLKAARSGIVAAIILGMGRAVGETMAVIMVAGNPIDFPHGPLDAVRTLTSNIALEMGYAAGYHRKALFATGIVLFVIIMVLNTTALALSRQRGRKGAAR